MSGERFVITRTRGRMLWWALAAMVMGIYGFFIGLRDEEFLREVFFFLDSPASLLGFRAIILFSASFFLLCAVLLFRMSNVREVLIADERGISDFSSSVALGFIPWEDIISLRIHSFMTEKFIEVGIKDWDKYFSKISVFKRLAIKANLTMGTSICRISLIGTGAEPAEVLARLEGMIKKHGNEVVSYAS